jgi:hypothetical protein
MGNQVRWGKNRVPFPKALFVKIISDAHCGVNVNNMFYGFWDKSLEKMLLDYEGE